jgi:hypothetical protein
MELGAVAYTRAAPGIEMAGAGMVNGAEGQSSLRVVARHKEEALRDDSYTYPAQNEKESFV